MHTKRLSGIRKMLMIVARDSSGTYTLRIFIIEGQNAPTAASKKRKATI